MSSNYRRVRGRKRPPVLYHWSPRRNRARILKHGLRPHELSVDRDWRPPYICFADTPFMGLNLCLKFRAGSIIDLYEVWLSGYPLYRRRDFGREYRVRVPVDRRRIRLIASRRVTAAARR